MPHLNKIHHGPGKLLLDYSSLLKVVSSGSKLPNSWMISDQAEQGENKN